MMIFIQWSLQDEYYNISKAKALSESKWNFVFIYVINMQYATASFNFMQIHVKNLSKQVLVNCIRYHIYFPSSVDLSWRYFCIPR
jgi:hypothetical protein